MDEYTSKRVAEGYTSRRGPSAVLRDNANSRDQDGKYCSRVGCSGRLNFPKGTRSTYSEKLKSPIQSFRTSSSGKEIVGSSSRTYYAVRGTKKSVAEAQRKISTQLETDSSETSSTQDEPEISPIFTSNERLGTGLNVGLKSSDCTDETIVEPGSSSVSPNTRARRDFNQSSGTSKKDTPDSSSVSTVSKSSRPTSHSSGRHTLRNFRCNSINDVISSRCSSSDLNLSKRKDKVKKKNSVAESSSIRGKKMNGSSSEKKITNSGYGVSISESRGDKNGSSNRENSNALGRSRTSINGTLRIGSRGNRPERNNAFLHESRSMVSQMLHEPERSINNSTYEVSTELISDHDHPIYYRRSDSINENILGHRPTSPAELGLARSLTTRDSFRHYGIPEILLALERTEHEEELTYEQVILLETNLLLSGLNFYDYHRDMRLDIDNMSYEELLALEERIGSVSTAVTEEALSQCLNKSTYQSRHAKDTSAGGSEYEDDIKCCICQEEYSNGDEVGMLQCEHTYHDGCIQQWLRLKNWCPICKASVEEPASALP